MDARRLVEEALGAARGAADEAAAREARRMVEEGIRVRREEEAAGQRGGGAAGQSEDAGAAVEVESRVRLPSRRDRETSWSSAATGPRWSRLAR